MVEINEDIVGRDSSERNGKSNSRVDWVRVQRQEDHEETCDAKHYWDEKGDLWTSQE